MGRGTIKVNGIVKKGLGEMSFNSEGGVINWFPGHMAAATRAIRTRLKLADLVIEVRDSRIPLSSANEDLQSQLTSKRRVIALNKRDLANPNIMHKWVDYFGSCKQDAIPINSHSKSSVMKVATDTWTRTRTQRNSLILRFPMLKLKFWSDTSSVRRISETGNVD